MHRLRSCNITAYTSHVVQGCAMVGRLHFGVVDKHKKIAMILNTAAIVMGGRKHCVRLRVAWNESKERSTHRRYF